MRSPNFSPFPLLRTSRLVLRPISVDDDRVLFKLRSDPETNRYLDRLPAHTIEQVRDFIQGVDDRARRNESVYWAIELPEQRAIAGTICLFAFSVADEACEIGFELLPSAQGRGVMTEAVGAVLDYAFRHLGILTLTAVAHRENARSIRLLEIRGFVPDERVVTEDPHLVGYSLKAGKWR